MSLTNTAFPYRELIIMRLCHSCQARNVGHSAFCIRCGAPLQAHDRQDATNTDALAVIAEQTPHTLVDEAAAQLADGQAAAAIENCRRAIALNPREVEAFVVLAMAFEQSGDLQSALDAYETVLSLAPDRPVERQKTALLRLRLGHEQPEVRREPTRFSCAHFGHWLRDQIEANPALAAGLGAGLLVFILGAALIVSGGRARAANALQQQYAYEVQLGDQALAEQRYAEATAHYAAAWKISPGDAALQTKWAEAYRQAQLVAAEQQRQLEIASTPKYIPNVTGRNPFAPVPIGGPPPAPATTGPTVAQMPVPPPTINRNATGSYDSVQGTPRVLPPSTPALPSSRRTDPNKIITPVPTPSTKSTTPPAAADTTPKPPKGEITIWVSQAPPSRPPAESRPVTNDAESLRARGEQLARDGNTAEAIAILERAASAFEERARQDPASGAASAQAASSCRARIEVLRQADR